jgi:hypothetical protein
MLEDLTMSPYGLYKGHFLLKLNGEIEIKFKQENASTILLK